MLIKVKPYRESGVILVNTTEISRVINSCNHSGSIIVMADGQRIEVTENPEEIFAMYTTGVKNDQLEVFTKTAELALSRMPKPADLKRQGVKEALELANNWVDMGFVSSDELMAIAKQFKD